MAPNPTCGPDTVDACSAAVPRLLYAKVTNVSGCSQFDGKVVQILHDSASGDWLSDDDDLVIIFNLVGGSWSLTAYCVGDTFFSAKTSTEACSTPVDESFPGCFLQCCGTVDIHIGELP